MRIDEHDAAASASAAVEKTGAAAVGPRRTWSVINMDSEHQKTVLVSRWRWYAAWWAGWLRVFDGDDMKIVRTR